MPILARHLALAAASLLVIGSTAAAAPKKKKGKAAPTAKLVHEKSASTDDIAISASDDEADETEADDEELDPADEAEDDEEPAPLHTKRKHGKKATRQAFEDSSDEEVDEVDEAPIKVKKKSLAKKGLRNWKIGVGPNVWLSSVEANVAVGNQSITAAVDFMAISHYTKFAAPLIAEARYKRFSFVGDMTYAVVGIKGGNDIGPLDVALTGNVSSLQFDGLAGYRVYGNEDSKFSAEARTGVRYARMAISGNVMLSGSEFAPKQIVSGSSDLLVGARIFAKPWKRVFASAAVDQSVAGTSDSTYSIGADANFRVSNYVLIGAGYKTMVQRSGSVTQTMYGPKFSVQVLF
jgi:hypothetical protein